MHLVSINVEVDQGRDKLIDEKKEDVDVARKRFSIQFIETRSRSSFSL